MQRYLTLGSQYVQIVETTSNWCQGSSCDVNATVSTNHVPARYNNKTKQRRINIQRHADIGVFTRCVPIQMDFVSSPQGSPMFSRIPKLLLCIPHNSSNAVQIMNFYASLKIHILSAIILNYLHLSSLSATIVHKFNSILSFIIDKTDFLICQQSLW